MRYDFAVTTECLNSETGIIALRGDITAFADDAMQAAYCQLTERGIRKIIFSFNKDDIIGSPGMAILIDIIVKAYENNQTLLMAVPSIHFQKVFGMIGITQYAQIFPSLDEAKEIALC